MLVVFIHGWSVTNTNTYGGLPNAVAKNADPSLTIQVANLYLGKYVSFADEVNVDDIARGMQQAVAEEILPKLSEGERFACITHSTGGPVVRKWVDLFFKEHLNECPMQHLIMLAPANHGSALAQLGKGRLSRMKFFAEGVQPGIGVLDWLELGSDQSWKLNLSWLDYRCMSSGLYVFVLTGQTIDHNLYDNLNSYTGEAGSDGVVRVAAANMNYGLIRLTQEDGGFKLDKQKHPEKFAFGILPGLSHSEEKGIMSSVQADDGPSHPTVNWVLQCLSVNSDAMYKKAVKALADLTDQTQAAERSRKTKELFLFEREFITSRYCMFVFRIVDDRNNNLTDYDVIFTAGTSDNNENHLPPGFFVDRQRNQLNHGKLTYYIDYDTMAEWLPRPELKGKLGFKIVARPSSGYAYYTVAAYNRTFSVLKQYFEPNQTIMVEIQLNRHVKEGVFRLTQDLQPEPFKDQPKGSDLP